jgi:leucyl aminopeptidase
MLSAGENSYDRAWHMPLLDDYHESLASNFADFANIGGRPGGAIVAACFLSKFAKKFNWAHLDIAGVAWKTGKEKGRQGGRSHFWFTISLRRLQKLPEAYRRPVIRDGNRLLHAR